MSSRATKTAHRQAAAHDRRRLASRWCRFCGVAGPDVAWAGSAVCAACEAMRARGTELFRDRQCAGVLGVTLMPGIARVARFRFARERDPRRRLGRPERVGTDEAWGHLDVPAMRARVAARWPMIYSTKESL